MNIFYVDSDPIKAAQALCDKHVVKMILESAQLLSTAHRLKPYFTVPDFVYKVTHQNHPSAIWARASLKNYFWLLGHTKALCDEYTFRYGKVHKTTNIVDWLSKYYPHIPFNPFTEPPQCMPDDFKVDGDSVTAYRAYYVFGKIPTIDCKWTKRSKPDWI